MADARLKTLLVLLVLSLYVRASKYQAETEDNDFADFEEFDDDEFGKPYGEPSAAADAQAGQREPDRPAESERAAADAAQEADAEDDDGLVEVRGTMKGVGLLLVLYTPTHAVVTKMCRVCW